MGFFGPPSRYARISAGGELFAGKYVSMLDFKCVVSGIHPEKCHGHAALVQGVFKAVFSKVGLDHALGQIAYFQPDAGDVGRIRSGTAGMFLFCEINADPVFAGLLKLHPVEAYTGKYGGSAQHGGGKGCGQCSAHSSFASASVCLCFYLFIDFVSDHRSYLPGHLRKIMFQVFISHNRSSIFNGLS